MPSPGLGVCLVHCRPGAFLCSWFLGVYSSLLLCWLPLLGACSRRCGSCRPPEVSSGLRSFWCVRFFLALRCVLPVALSRTWIPVGVSLCYGVYSSLLLCWLPLLGACVRRCGSCRPPEVSFGLRSFWCVRFFLALWGVLPVALSLAWIPAGVSLCYGVHSSLLPCWLPLLGACSRRCGSCRPPEVSFGLRSFWCVCFFLALGCVLPVAMSRTWIPAGVSLCYGVYSSLLLCWLPLLGACVRRCGSCRPPEVSFGLRSFWCVRFFLALGCVLPVALSLTWIPAGISLCCGVYSSLLLCWLPLLGACSRRCGSCRPPEVSFGLRSFWCIHFFLALGCVLPVALSLTWILAYTLLCSFAGCRCWAPAFGAAALAGLLRLALVYGRFGVFASSWLWGAFCRWPCPVLGFPLVFGFVMGYTLLCSFAGCRCWAPAFGAAALAGLLRLALVCGRFGVFASSWLWGAFCRWPCPVLGFLLVFRFVMGYTLPCSFAGCRCWAPAPGAAALAGLLRSALVYGRFGVFASSWLWGAFCQWPCPLLGFSLILFSAPLLAAAAGRLRSALRLLPASCG